MSWVDEDLVDTNRKVENIDRDPVDIVTEIEDFGSGTCLK